MRNASRPQCHAFLAHAFGVMVVDRAYYSSAESLLMGKAPVAVAPGAMWSDVRCCGGSAAQAPNIPPCMLHHFGIGTGDILFARHDNHVVSIVRVVTNANIGYRGLPTIQPSSYSSPLQCPSTAISTINILRRCREEKTITAVCCAGCSAKTSYSGRESAWHQVDYRHEALCSRETQATPRPTPMTRFVLSAPV